MATAVPATGADQLAGGLGAVLVQDLEQFPVPNLTCRTGYGGHGEVCAICLDKIELEETALIKGCEHAYCVTCILHWATYKEKPTCPQCKHPLEFLNIHRSLDGSLHDHMLEESVCLLLRAVWFKPLEVEDYAHAHDESEDNNNNPYGYGYDYDYDYDYDDEDEIRAAYLGNSSSSSSSSGSVRIGNRRWGDSGYVRGGRQEARPAANRGSNSTKAAVTSSSRQQPNKQQKEDKMGRRAKRALKREAEDKAAAAKHQNHLARLGLGMME